MLNSLTDLQLQIYSCNFESKTKVHADDEDWIAGQMLPQSHGEISPHEWFEHYQGIWFRTQGARYCHAHGTGPRHKSPAHHRQTRQSVSAIKRFIPPMETRVLEITNLLARRKCWRMLEIRLTLLLNGQVYEAGPMNHMFAADLLHQACRLTGSLNTVRTTDIPPTRQ